MIENEMYEKYKAKILNSSDYTEEKKNKYIMRIELLELKNSIVILNSYHLSNLKKANLITETKQKNFIFYELNSSVFEDVLVWIYKLGGNKNGKEK